MACKRQRLTKLASRTTNISELTNVLAELDNIHPGLGASRFAVARAVRADLSSATPSGTILPSMDLQAIDPDTKKSFTFKWSYLDPASMVWFLSNSSPAFASALRRARGIHGAPSVDKPWDVIWYVDETQPGIMLKTDNKRNVQCPNWSYAQLGRET